MRHVITGGAGFVGNYLTAALLARGERVVVFDATPPKTNAAAEFIKGDIRDAADLAKIAFAKDDIVHHLAARQFHAGVPYSHRDEWFAEVNVGGTQKLLEAMAAGGTKRIVFFSTDMTYGVPQATPVPPTHPQHPIGPYGRSKVKAERLLAEAQNTQGLRATVFRPRLISGAGRLGILSKLFKLIRAGLPVPLIGSGRNRYQMIAVEDCVSAALAAVERDCPIGPFNLGSRNPPTVRALLHEIIARVASRSILVPTPAFLAQGALAALDTVGLTLLHREQYAIANVDYILDTRGTTEALGWEPRRTDQDILFEAYANFVESEHGSR